MTKIERETNEISEIYRAKETNRTFFGLGGWLYSFFCREHIGSYIMTIGVVDECRRFGLGSKLLDHTIRLLNVKWP